MMPRQSVVNLGGLALAAMVGVGLNVPAYGQDMRDPTTPPTAVSAVPGAPVASPWGGDSGMSVIVRDGKAGLVVGTRVVQPGQKIGTWTLDRITETEVWLRDGATLRKVPRFSGIQRHDPAASPACALRATPKTLSKAPPASTKVDPQCDAPLTRSSNP